MDKAEKEQKSSPPVLAYRTFDNSVRVFKQAIPSHISRGVFPSQSGLGQTQILHAYRYLDLIDAKGTPQERFVRLVKSEGAEHQKVLREILTAAYPFLRDNSIDLKTTTQDKLSEQFRKLASGDTVRKCLTFFIPAAKAAGFEMSPFIRDLGKRTPSSGKPRKPRVGNRITPVPVTPSDNRQEQPASPSPMMSWHEMLLSKFPSFDPSWPDDVKKKWFESFGELMSRGGAHKVMS